MNDHMYVSMYFEHNFLFYIIDIIAADVRRWKGIYILVELFDCSTTI